MIMTVVIQTLGYNKVTMALEFPEDFMLNSDEVIVLKEIKIRRSDKVIPFDFVGKAIIKKGDNTAFSLIDADRPFFQSSYSPIRNYAHSPLEFDELQIARLKFSSIEELIYAMH